MKKLIILFVFVSITVYTLCSCMNQADTSSDVPNDFSRHSETDSDVIKENTSVDRESCEVSQDESREYSESLDSSSTDSEDNCEPNTNDTSSEENSESEVSATNIGEQLDSMLGEYSFVSYENEKTIIQFYSEKQIQELQNKRDKGERYSLAKEELNFIVSNTISVFEEYDIIYIRDIDGNLHKYYGLSFYSSEDYYNSFCGFNLGVTDATFDYRRDLFDVLFMRLSVLSSSVQNGFEPGGIVFSNTDNLSEDTLKDLAEAFEQVYVYESRLPQYTQLLADYAGSAILFDTRDTFAVYCSDLSKGANSDYRYLFHNEQLDSYISPLIGHYKYDTDAGKAVIVELYEEKNQKLIARIRLDERNNPNEIAEIERLSKFKDNGATSTGDVITKYRAVIYLNGISILGYPRDSVIKYNPDGDIDRFDVTYGDDIFPRNPLWLKGATPLTNYINGLLEKELTKQD